MDIDIICIVHVVPELFLSKEIKLMTSYCQLTIGIMMSPGFLKGMNYLISSVVVHVKVPQFVGWGGSLGIEHLPGIYEPLGSIPSTAKKKKR
jgi:hypothetical protein